MCLYYVVVYMFNMIDFVSPSNLTQWDHPPGSGTTSLHLVASLGLSHVDAVYLLIFDKTINPDSRLFLNASRRSLKLYSPSPLSCSHSAPGISQSHFWKAACRKDLYVIELTVSVGMDIFVRNRKGNLKVSKDEH
jgi:hypothetical protein